MRMGRYRGRPIYGRVVHKVPFGPLHHDPAERNRAFEEVAKMYGSVRSQIEPARRRMTAFRLSGGGHLPVGLPQTGSFQHLKVSLNLASLKREFRKKIAM